MVAAESLLTVVLGLVQLPKLLPQPWLGWLPEQCLHTAVQGLQLPMEGSWGGCPTKQKGRGGVRLEEQGPALLPTPSTLQSSLTLEHNMVCSGAQSYCRVKGVGEQTVEAARGWQSTW